jgi:hypothetical protein
MFTLPQGKMPPLATGLETRWAPETVWIQWQRGKFFTCQELNPNNSFCIHSLHCQLSINLTVGIIKTIIVVVVIQNSFHSKITACRLDSWGKYFLFTVTFRWTLGPTHSCPVSTKGSFPSSKVAGAWSLPVLRFMMCGALHALSHMPLCCGADAEGHLYTTCYNNYDIMMIITWHNTWSEKLQAIWWTARMITNVFICCCVSVLRDHIYIKTLHVFAK